MTRDIFNDMVTCGHVYSKESATCTMHDFLTMCQRDPVQRHQVQELRKRVGRMHDAANVMGTDCEAYQVAFKEYEQIKKSLPACKTSGIIDLTTGKWKSFTDIVCLDIDNPKPHQGKQIFDVAEMKHNLSALPFVAYCGLSASGTGVFCLVPVASHNLHVEHWQALRSIIKKLFAVEVDANTHDVTRWRYASHDPAPYINHNAMVFECVEQSAAQQPRPVQKKVPSRSKHTYTNDNTDARVSYLVEQIERTGTDITQNYNEWLQAAAALAHHYGDAGRDMFHTIARQNNKYKYRENERLFTSLQRGASREASLGSFFFLCKRYGLNVGNIQPKAPPRPPRAKDEPTRARMEVQRASIAPPAAVGVPIEDPFLLSVGITTEQEFKRIMNLN